MTTKLPTIGLACLLLSLPAGVALAGPFQQPDHAQATPQQQNDQQLAAKVRKALAADKTVAASAQSIEITSQNGMVTLRGSVKSQEEKKAIEDIATKIAGAGKVTDELTVTP